jgi:hypothetical protein
VRKNLVDKCLRGVVWQGRIAAATAGYVNGSLSSSSSSLADAGYK